MLSLLQKFRHSRLREVLWPLRSHELIKFIPMAFLMFTVLLNQNLVRCMKDALVMTYMGSEVINFIKLIGEAPAGLLFVIIYSKLCNRMSTEQVFRYVVSFFLICFGIFGFVIFPNLDFFHPSSDQMTSLAEAYPHFKWFIVLGANWSFVVFYILGELWPVIVFSLLYWQLANKITRTEEAGRFYSFFSLFGQTNLLISGTALAYFAGGDHFLSRYFVDIQDKTEVMIKSVVLIVLASGVVCLLLHRFIEQKIVKNPKFGIVKQGTKDKLKLTLKESTSIIMKSKYLWLICVLLIGYSLTINCLEGLWMSKVKERYPDTLSFTSYHGNVLFWTGVFTLICSFLGSSVIRYFGWFWGAVSTPLMIMIFGGGFFASVLAQPYLASLNWLDPLYIIVMIGGLQHVMGKGTKYSLSDATKEMAYIPLDNEMKTKGKAAVDIIGVKLGKASGSILQCSLFTIFPFAHYDDIASILISVFLIVCVIWIVSVKALSHEYAKHENDPNHLKSR